MTATRTAPAVAARAPLIGLEEHQYQVARALSMHAVAALYACCCSPCSADRPRGVPVAGVWVSVGGWVGGWVWVSVSVCVCVCVCVSGVGVCVGVGVGVGVGVLGIEADV